MVKKIACVLLFAVAIVSVAAGPNQTLGQLIKNTIGDIKGYGRCKNCGDSYWWKTTKKDYPDGTEGMTVCDECLAHPEKLNEDRIEKNLLSIPWFREKDRAANVRKKIQEYKFKHGIRYL